MSVRLKQGLHPGTGTFEATQAWTTTTPKLILAEHSWIYAPHWRHDRELWYLWPPYLYLNRRSLLLDILILEPRLCKNSLLQLVCQLWIFVLLKWEMKTRTLKCCNSNLAWIAHLTFKYFVMVLHANCSCSDKLVNNTGSIWIASSQCTAYRSCALINLYAG